MAATELVSAAPAPGKARRGRWRAFARVSGRLTARMRVLALPAAVIVILGAMASLLAAPAIVVADQWLDVFLALDAGQPQRVFLNSKEDLDPRRPIIDGAGQYRLTYELVAVGFPTTDVVVDLNLTGTIDAEATLVTP